MYSTSKSFDDLNPNTTYYFRVKAVSSQAAYEDSSYGTRSVKTKQIPLEIPTLDQVSALNSDSLSVTYVKVEHANKYIIEYSTNNNFTNKQSIEVV